MLINEQKCREYLASFAEKQEGRGIMSPEEERATILSSVQNNIGKDLDALRCLQKDLAKVGICLRNGDGGGCDAAGWAIQDLEQPILGAFINLREYLFDLEDLRVWLKNPVALLAKSHGVDEESFKRWDKAQDGHGKGYVTMGCNHPGCKMTTSIYFDSPVSMLEAESQAASGIWYCRHHEEIAWKTDMVISDDLVTVLQRIEERPGCSKTGSGAKTKDMEFLERMGLLRISMTGTTVV